MKCLIVDDDELNVEMTTDILNMINVENSYALSANEAIDILIKSEDTYPVILMDYRMPHMDGAECTKCIRKLENEGKIFNRPLIIGLSGDDDENSKLIMLKAGEDVVLRKPVDINEIIPYLKERGFKIDGPSTVEVLDEDNIYINRFSDTDFNPDNGIKYSGSFDKYLKSLKSFLNNISSKLLIIENLYVDNDIKNFTIEIHALKSNFRFLGNDKLSSLCADLEKAGDDENISEINRLYSQFKADVIIAIDNLNNKIFIDEKDKLKSFDKEAVKDILSALSEMILAYDIDGCDNCINELALYDMPDKCSESFLKLKESIDVIDYETAKILVDKIGSIIWD